MPEGRAGRDAALCRQALGHGEVEDHPEGRFMSGDRAPLERMFAALDRGEIPRALAYRFELDLRWRGHRRRVDQLLDVNVRRASSSEQAFVQSELRRHQPLLDARTAALCREQASRCERMLASGSWEPLWRELEG
ncbi:MAG: hypothetical protein GY913_23735 [Proteobacteria bacterium]|nr:hypothetical protein [Pseudomonadota bacterium]MCP4919926.1 hypothetical protein [Pseudomonadota bacterium]